jgi:hypothetical protein
MMSAAWLVYTAGEIASAGGAGRNAALPRLCWILGGARAGTIEIEPVSGPPPSTIVFMARTYVPPSPSPAPPVGRGGSGVLQLVPASIEGE